MRNTPGGFGASSPPSSGGKYRARLWPSVKYARKPCRSTVDTRADTPSIFDCCHAIGNVIVVFNSVLKS